MKKTIRVTQSHIDMGVPEDCDICPIAIALHEAFPECIFGVHGDYAFFARRREKLKIKLTDSCGAFVAAFDAGLPVTPFEFEVELPE